MGWELGGEEREEIGSRPDFHATPLGEVEKSILDPSPSKSVAICNRLVLGRKSIIPQN